MESGGEPKTAAATPVCFSAPVTVAVKLPLNCHELLPFSNPQFCTTLLAGGSTTSMAASSAGGNAVLGSAPYPALLQLAL